MPVIESVLGSKLPTGAHSAEANPRGTSRLMDLHGSRLRSGAALHDGSLSDASAKLDYDKERADVQDTPLVDQLNLDREWWQVGVDSGHSTARPGDVLLNRSYSTGSIDTDDGGMPGLEAGSSSDELPGPLLGHALRRHGVWGGSRAGPAAPVVLHLRGGAPPDHAPGPAHTGVQPQEQASTGPAEAQAPSGGNFPASLLGQFG